MDDNLPSLDLQLVTGIPSCGSHHDEIPSVLDSHHCFDYHILIPLYRDDDGSLPYGVGYKNMGVVVL